MPRLSILVLLLATASSRAENWPDFRGPSGQGHYDGKSLPIEWSTSKNVVWKQAIPGKGWSSPIVQEGRVYLTTAVPQEEGKKGQSLQAVCLDADKGTILWQHRGFPPGRPSRRKSIPRTAMPARRR